MKNCNRYRKCSRGEKIRALRDKNKYHELNYQKQLGLSLAELNILIKELKV